MARIRSYRWCGSTCLSSGVISFDVVSDDCCGVGCAERMIPQVLKGGPASEQAFAPVSTIAYRTLVG